MHPKPPTTPLKNTLQQGLDSVEAHLHWEEVPYGLLKGSPGMESALSVEEALGLFFTLFHLEKTMEARKLFWTQQRVRGQVCSAHLVLTPQAHCRVHDLLPSKASAPLSGFYPDRHILSGQGALMLRLSGATVVEWSHGGKCRLWRHLNPHAPRLFQKMYAYGDLTSYADRVQQHYFTKAGLWQRDLERWLEGL